MPKLVLSDVSGNIYIHPTLKMAGSGAGHFFVPLKAEMIVLPEGSTLFHMPGHAAAGWDEEASDFTFIREFQNREVFPVAAFMIPGFTRLYLPAAEKMKKQIALPLWPYTAVGWKKGKFYACAVQVDRSKKQRPFYYSLKTLLKENIRVISQRFPKNRLFKHLSRCALAYNCPNAWNLFLKRWEAPLPISPACNAKCLGCLSFQDSDCAMASHERISFVPTPEEVSEVGLGHLEEAREAMVSFGQGCEGEPLLQFKVLRESIELIRRRTRRGTIHLNTNGFNPAYLKELAAIGLNSVRISTNSFRKERYEAYYRPRGYCLRDVLDSLTQAKKSGLFVSLNLLVFPGFTDSRDEVDALVKFLKKGYIDLIQLRNLSIDPDFFRRHMPYPTTKPMGILEMIALVKKNCPEVRLGYFNLPKEKWARPL